MNNTTEFGWGIIGTGSIASAFAHSIEHCSHSKLSGVYGRNAEPLNIFSKKFKVEPFNDIESFLDTSDIDAVYVATPHNTHFKYSLEAIKNNKHVLCEKPLTMNHLESMILLNLAKDKTSQVFHNLSSKVFSPVENSEPSSDDVKSLDSKEDIVSTISSEFTNPSNEIAPDFLINSRSLIYSVINTLNLHEDYNLLLLSGSGGRIDLEFLGKKSLIVPVDSIGDVLNYSLRQVGGEDQYKHGFLVKYSAFSIPNESNSKVNIDDLKSLTSSMKKVLLKTLPPIFDSSYKRTPVILRVEGFDNIMIVLNYLSTNGDSNTTLDKFVFKTFENNLDPSAFYYIAINDELDSK